MKGLITGLLMVVAAILLSYFKASDGSALHYLTYIIFGLGIVWAVSGSYLLGQIKFGKLFEPGFRCFVVATLVMAIYSIIYYKLNPEIIERSAEMTRIELLKTERNRTPAEIDEIITNGKKHFILTNTSVFVFQYLFIGAIVTASAAGILSISKKN